METKIDLSDWTNPDLSLPDEPAPEPTAPRCIGCGVEVKNADTPHCGH